MSQPTCVVPDNRAINHRRPANVNLIPVVFGSLDPDHIYEKAKQVISQVTEDDLLLVGIDNPLATAICVAVWLAVHKKVNLLRYDVIDDKWHTFSFDRGERRQDIEAFLDRIKAAKEA